MDELYIKTNKKLMRNDDVKYLKGIDEDYWKKNAILKTRRRNTNIYIFFLWIKLTKKKKVKTYNTNEGYTSMEAAQGHRKKEKRNATVEC